MDLIPAILQQGLSSRIGPMRIAACQKSARCVQAWSPSPCAAIDTGRCALHKLWFVSTNSTFGPSSCHCVIVSPACIINRRPQAEHEKACQTRHHSPLVLSSYPKTEYLKLQFIVSNPSCWSEHFHLLTKEQPI